MGHLFLVRHSTTEASAGGRNLGQRSDAGLTADGVELARSLGATLRAELAELRAGELRIVSSPARRCRDTALAIAEALQVAPGRVEIEPALIEIDYGAWEGLTAEECRRRDPELRAAWEEDPYRTRCPGGESGGDVAARAFPRLDSLQGWAAEDRARCGVVVSHNHVGRLRLCAVFGWPMADYRRRITTDPASYSLLTVADARLSVRRVNAAPMSPDAAAPVETKPGGGPGA